MAGRKIIRLKESVVLFDLYVAGEGDESLVVMSFFFSEMRKVSFSGSALTKFLNLLINTKRPNRSNHRNTCISVSSLLVHNN